MEASTSLESSRNVLRAKRRLARVLIEFYVRVLIEFYSRVFIEFYARVFIEFYACVFIDFYARVLIEFYAHVFIEFYAHVLIEFKRVISFHSPSPLSPYLQTLSWLKTGALSRTVGSTNMNAQSSRSHAIFTLQIAQQRPIKTLVQWQKNILSQNFAYRNFFPFI